VLGADAVIDERSEVNRRSVETSHGTRAPTAFVYPSSTEQVQQVVRLANEHKVRLFPSSRGHNWGYGGNNSLDSEAVVVALERMNRILEVNQELAYAVIEPGVTYEQLHKHLFELGHHLWADTTDGPPRGSVLGNALDRGVGETPYGDHFGNLCGMEVVLPTGELVHSGGSAPDNPTKTWHTHKWGVGPYFDGAFTQSNFGIVTRAGIWLMPKPETRVSYVFELGSDEHLAAAIDAFRVLALQGVVSSKLHLISDFVSLTILTQHINEEVDPGLLSPGTLSALGKKYGFARWSGAASLYGSPGFVSAQKRNLKKALGAYGKLMFFNDTSVKWVERLLAKAQTSPWVRRLAELMFGRSIGMLNSIPYLHRLFRGEPTRYFLNHAYYRMPTQRPGVTAEPAADGVGLTWFAPVLPFTGHHVTPFLAEARKRFEAQGFDFYQAMLMVNPRSVVCLMGILYRKADPAEVARASALYDELLKWVADQGYQQYRAAVASWPTMFERAPEWGQMLEKVRSALDPNDVLAPGKYGLGKVPPRSE